MGETMEKVYKLIKQKVVISPNIRSIIDLKAEVYSQDIDVTKIVVELESANGELIDLTGATVTVGLKVNNVTIEDVGQVEDVSNRLISYCPGERFKIDEGTVTLGFFVTLNTGQRIDIQNYKINFKRSLIDTATEEEVKPYFTSLDTIVSELKDHTASKKYEIDDVVSDVRSTGDTAKSDIKAVLPSVKAEISEIKTDIENLPDIPDLFVAYADDINGRGFSKTNTSKLYKGYGVKNSNLATDYRWERNSTNLQIGGRNLFIDAGFKSDISTESDYVPGKWYSYDGKTFNRPKYDNTCNYLYFVTGGDASTGIMQFFDTNKLVKGETYSVSTLVKVDANTTFKYQLVKKNPDSTYNWYLKNVDIQVTTISEWVVVKWTFTIPKDDDGIAYGISIRNLQTGTEPALRLLKPKLEIGNVCTGFSLAHEDLMLNASPINSVLTTLSQENPSTTLGGTWTQLGTESKFSQTIYYWKRTK